MNVREQSVNAIRVLSAEAIQKANSGHPGLPLGSAPIGYTIFADFLKFNPKDTKWDDRDRFILSAGHGSMLNYSLLYLFGYDISKEDLMNFRQLGSKTPGHPEYGHTPGVETTTGPLGQGIANAVGMALAEAHLAAIFNREGFPIVDHYTYALCGDGCLEEGISYEACSFAGANKLGKLILLYDDNDITIEGDTDITFKEDVALRFKAQGWQVLKVDDVNDLDLLKRPVSHIPHHLVSHFIIDGIHNPLQHGCHYGGHADLDQNRQNASEIHQPLRNNMVYGPPHQDRDIERQDDCHNRKQNGKSHPETVGADIAQYLFQGACLPVFLFHSAATPFSSSAPWNWER